MRLLSSQVTELPHIMWAIANEAVHVVGVLWDTALSERGDILEINLIELSVPWVTASPIAKGGLVTFEDVLLEASDVVV